MAWGDRAERELAAIVVNGSSVCALCGNPVDKTLNWRDPMAASVDHITPRSRGGKDVLSNLQLAHRRCNIARGNKPMKRKRQQSQQWF